MSYKESLGQILANGNDANDLIIANLAAIYVDQVSNQVGTGQFYFDGGLMNMQTTVDFGTYGIQNLASLQFNGGCSGQIFTSDAFGYGSWQDNTLAKVLAVCGDGGGYGITNVSSISLTSNCGVVMPSGASNGYVLTCDGSGLGTWQPAGAGSTPGLCAVLAVSNDGGSQDISNIGSLTAGCNIIAGNDVTATASFISGACTGISGTYNILSLTSLTFQGGILVATV